jgi:hypothetical protein
LVKVQVSQCGGKGQERLVVPFTSWTTLTSVPRAGEAIMARHRTTLCIMMLLLLF